MTTTTTLPDHHHRHQKPQHQQKPHPPDAHGKGARERKKALFKIQQMPTENDNESSSAFDETLKDVKKADGKVDTETSCSLSQFSRPSFSSIFPDAVGEVENFTDDVKLIAASNNDEEREEDDDTAIASTSRQLPALSPSIKTSPPASVLQPPMNMFSPLTEMRKDNTEKHSGEPLKSADAANPLVDGSQVSAPYLQNYFQRFIQLMIHQQQQQQSHQLNNSKNDLQESEMRQDTATPHSFSASPVTLVSAPVAPIADKKEESSVTSTVNRQQQPLSSTNNNNSLNKIFPMAATPMMLGINMDQVG